MRKRTEDTRLLIIDAAQRQFFAHGYTATTIDAIAAEVGLTKRTVYGYFENKRALFLEVIRNAIGNPPDEFFFRKELHTRQDIADMLYAVASGLNDVTTRPNYIHLLRIAIAEIPFQPDVGVLLEQSMAHQSIDWLSAFFTEANQKGIATITHPDALARSFAGSFIIRMVLNGLLQSPNSKGVTPLSQKEIKALVDTFMDGMIRA